MKTTAFGIALAALAFAVGCSGKSTTPTTTNPTPSPKPSGMGSPTPVPSPSPVGSPGDVLFLSGASSGTCNDVKAFALPQLTPLGSFDVAGYCAGAFSADKNGNLYAMETDTSAQGYVYEFSIGSVAATQSQSGLCFPQAPGNGFIAFDDASGTFYIAACSATSYDLVNQYKVGSNAPVRTLAEPNGNTGGLVTWPRIGFDAGGYVWAGFNANDSAIAGIKPNAAFVTAQFSKSASVTKPSFKVAAQAPTAEVVTDPKSGVWILHQFLPSYAITPVPYYFKPGACTFDSASPVTGDDVRFLLAQHYTGSSLAQELFTSANPDGSGGLHDENALELALDATGIAYVSYAYGAGGTSGVAVFDQAAGANGPDGVPVRCPDAAHAIVPTTAGIASLGVDSANNLYVANASSGTVTQYAPGGQVQTAQIGGFVPFFANAGGFGQIVVRTVSLK